MVNRFTSLGETVNSRLLTYVLRLLITGVPQ